MSLEYFFRQAYKIVEENRDKKLPYYKYYNWRIKQYLLAKAEGRNPERIHPEIDLLKKHLKPIIDKIKKGLLTTMDYEYYPEIFTSYYYSQMEYKIDFRNTYWRKLRNLLIPYFYPEWKFLCISKTDARYKIKGVIHYLVSNPKRFFELFPKCKPVEEELMKLVFVKKASG